MNHYTDQETQEIASAYAMGALSQNDAESFKQHLAEGCEPCQRLVREFESVVGDLGFTVTAVAPSPQVRERLMTSVRNEKSDHPAITVTPYTSNLHRLTIRANEGDWMPISQGVAVKQLFVDEARNTVTVLVKMDPGSQIPKHRHPVVEECMMLEGELHSGGEFLRAGDYQVSLPGSTHDRISTVNGALFLIVGPPSYEALEQL